MPMNMRAAKRLLKLVANPAHMLENTSTRRLESMTGRRPIVFASGTHHMFEAPNIKMFTATKYVSCEKLFGGSPNTGVDAYIGNELDKDADVKFTTKGCIDMTARIASFLHVGKLSGSAGSADGCGTRRISS
jgi:hypothetical protein